MLTSHKQELSNEQLLQLQSQFAYQEDDSNPFIEMSEEQNLTSKKNFQSDVFDSGWSFKVSKAVATNIDCYKEIYFAFKKKCLQQTLDQYFVKRT